MSELRDASAYQEGWRLQRYRARRESLGEVVQSLLRRRSVRGSSVFSRKDGEDRRRGADPKRQWATDAVDGEPTTSSTRAVGPREIELSRYFTRGAISLSDTP